MSQYNISGPVNIIRLEGKIDGIKKIIYLFMDIHNPENEQTKCSTPSLEIEEFLKNNFNNLINYNKYYDFFVEFQPGTFLLPKKKQWYNRNIYLDRVLRFFKKYLNYNPTSNEVKTSKIFKNIRFHYIDIRDWLEYYIFEIIGQLFILLYIESKNEYTINNIIKLLDMIIDELYRIKSFIQQPKIVKDSHIILEELPSISIALKPDIQKRIVEKIRYLIGKFLLKINNKKIKNIINEYVNIIIIPEFNKIIKIMKNLKTSVNGNQSIPKQYNYVGVNNPIPNTKICLNNKKCLSSAIYRDIAPESCTGARSSAICGELQGYTASLRSIRDNLSQNDRLSEDIAPKPLGAKSFKRNINNNNFHILYNDLMQINDIEIIPLFAQLMDIYFLRRFLDKKYITNAIVYVGSAHAAIYIDILVNLFNFKITHASLAITNNINKINKLVRKLHPFKSGMHYHKITDNILNIFLPLKNKIIQCSNISSFPKNFE